ncbi:hypothetical protein [Paenarthrobacter aromaticivorans]|uniref:Uncharacterized protein n=1 Tax=Paenarthrobacter aromaticivorans TaxID=2849150 RepID=A0ABS6IEX7_9MICC|nr:hypothetical protein [Paenarthrobacter sp. MMS21-TAE1-1]MBU8868972.1 hypothetical protein [Paenarthrobacter sp. MMS21-TAE1-1]
MPKTRSEAQGDNGLGATRRKLKSVRDGDRVEIHGEVFRVSSVQPEDGTRNIRVELQANDGGTLTLIGVPRAEVHVPANL